VETTEQFGRAVQALTFRWNRRTPEAVWISGEYQEFSEKMHEQIGRKRHTCSGKTPEAAQ